MHGPRVRAESCPRQHRERDRPQRTTATALLAGGSVKSRRAVRRHHEQRIKRRVTRYHGGHAVNQVRAVGKLARTRRPCSCWMCGNPRRHLGEVTVQERRLAGAGIDGEIE